MEKIWDVIIVGAGPAGLAAGLYAGRAKLRTLIIEKSGGGGQIAITAEIENYPGGLLEGESGSSLTERMAAQAQRFGAERTRDEIVGAELAGPVKRLRGQRGEYLARAVILAPGAYPRPIDCPGERSLVGKGVS